MYTSDDLTKKPVDKTIVILSILIVLELFFVGFFVKTKYVGNEENIDYFTEEEIREAEVRRAMYELTPQIVIEDELTPEEKVKRDEEIKDTLKMLTP